MIKKCTNKKCGKKFEVPNNRNAACPYCGTVHLWTSKKIKTYSVVLNIGKSYAWTVIFLRDLCGFNSVRAREEVQYIKRYHLVILKKNLSYEEAVKYKRSLPAKSVAYDGVNIIFVKEPVPSWPPDRYRDLSQDVCWNEK